MAKKRIVRGSDKSIPAPSAHNDHQHTHHHEPAHASAHAHHARSSGPDGMKLLRAYSAILLVFYALYFMLGLYKPQLLFLGGTFISYTALFIDALFVISLAILIFGLKKRRRWAWLLGMLWYGLSVFHSIWSVYITAPNVYNVLHELLIMSSVFLILVSIVTVWYIHSKRAYFTDPHTEHRHERNDKIFVYTLVCFWAVMLLLSITIGMDFYKETTQIASGMINELKDTTPLHAITICETKEGTDRDVCFVVLVTVFKNERMEAVCSRIDSDLYRFICTQAIS